MRTTILRVIAIILLFHCFSVAVFSQSPAMFKYQAVLRDANGNAITGNLSITIKIYTQATEGTPVYAETHDNVAANSQGVINLIVGSKEPLSGINWNSGNYYLGISINSEPELGRSQLLSVPYALNAKVVENETDPLFSGWNKKDGITISESQITDLQNYLLTETDGSVTNEIELPTDAQQGDLAYYNGEKWMRLPKGTDGQVLLLEAGLPVWKTLFPEPIVNIAPASFIEYTKATLNTVINPNGIAYAMFEYGTGTNYGKTIEAVPYNVLGFSDVMVSAELLNLTPGTTYHYRVVVYNAQKILYSEDQTFTTPAIKANCKQILLAGESKGNGIYPIDIDGPGGIAGFNCYCDMTTAGGGWTLVANNVPEYVSPSLNYATATGSAISMNGTLGLATTDLWYGLTLWSQLGTELMYQVGTTAGIPTNSAKFNFTINKYSNYQLTLSNPIILLGGTTPGLYTVHNNAFFSASDVDHDDFAGSCSAAYGNTAWWYVSCWDGSLWGTGGSSRPFWTGSSGTPSFTWGAMWVR